MRKSVCAGQGERTLAPHCRQSAARFTLTFCSSRCPRQQVPIRAEKCEHIVLCPTHSPRCGRRSGLARHSGDGLVVPDIGSRLTYSRASACCVAPTPDICHRQTRASGSLGHYHCALHLNPAEKVPAPTAGGSSQTAIAEAHTACAALQPNAQSSLFRNACDEPEHTLHRQSAGAPFPLPASPML